MATGKKVVKKRKVIIEAYGQAHIKASFNNIIISITNNQGQVISWSSAGKMGFRGSKKNTPYAAQLASTDAGKVAFDAGMFGCGGRPPSMRSIISSDPCAGKTRYIGNRKSHKFLRCYVSFVPNLFRQ